MNLRSLAIRLLPPILVPSAWYGGSSFESVNPSTRRGDVPGVAATDTKAELTRYVRSEMVRRSRYLHRNSGFIRELTGNMVIYSTGDGIRVQAQSGDRDWNRAAEHYFDSWSMRCEVSDRFSFPEVQALVCRGMDVDGEYFIHKTRRNGEPRLQLIESHRIGDRSNGESIDGVMLDEFGAPIAYRIIRDDRSTIDIPASAILHIYEPESATAVRQHPTIQHSINHVLDEIELLALEKHAVKDNADVARVLETQRGDIGDDGDFQVATPTGESSDVPTLQKIVGGKLVKLQPGEKLESFQSNRPSPTFTGFLEHLRRDSSMGVLPYEFAADPSKAGGAGIRLVVAKADRRFSFRQMILQRRLIQPVWAYVIGDAITRRLLPPAPDWWRIATVTPRRITVDTGREAQQNRADVEMGLKTLSDHYSELGADAAEEIERRAIDAKLILETAAKHGVPVQMIWNPSNSVAQVTPTDPAAGAPNGDE